MGVMNLAEVMDRSIGLLRKYIKTILMFTIGYGVIFIIGFIIGLIIFTIGSAIFIGLSATVANTPGVILMAVVFSLMFLIAMAFSLTLHVGIIKISAQEYIDERVYASEAIGASLKSIFKIFGIVVVAALLFIPVIAVFGAGGYFLYKGFERSSINLGIYGAAEIGLIVLSILAALAAILGILAYVTLFIFSIHALVIEKKGILGAVKRSWQLVGYNFWRVFGSLILISFAIYGITVSLESFIALCGSIIFMLLNFLNVKSNYMTVLAMIYSTASWPLSLLAWTVISPVGTIMISLLYFNVRFKKEGFDITLRLRQIQKNYEREQLSEVVANDSN